MTKISATQIGNYRDIADVDHQSLESFSLEEISNDYSFGRAQLDLFEDQAQSVRAFSSAPASLAAAVPLSEATVASAPIEGSDASLSVKADDVPNGSDASAVFAPLAADQSGPVGLAPGNTFNILDGTDLLFGTDGDDTFIGDSKDIEQSDVIVGGGGIDTLHVTGGYGSAWISGAERFEGIERIIFDEGQGNNLFVSVESFRDVEFVDFGAGEFDTLFFDSGIYDLSERTILGAEKLWLRNSVIEVTDKSLAFLAYADFRDEQNNGVVLKGGQTFTVEERAQIFGAGIGSITDASGTYTNVAPTLLGFGIEESNINKGETILLDPTGTSTVTDDGVLGSLKIWTQSDESAAQVKFGISTLGGVVALPDGLVIGGKVRVDGVDIGTITQDGTTNEGLVVTFNENGTAARVQSLVHALNFTSLDVADFPRKVTYHVVLLDQYGLWTDDAQSSVNISDPANDPAVSVTPQNYSILDTQTVTLFPGATISDPQNDELTLVVRLSQAANGTLTGYTSGSYQKAAGLYFLKGTAAEVQAALQSLVFVPKDRDDPGAIETTKFSIEVIDSTGFTKNSTVSVSARDGLGNAAPTDVLLSETTVKEFAANTSGIGTLSAVDPDLGDTFTYAFAKDVNDVTQDGEGRFDIQEINGEWLVVVKDGIRIDFEQKRTFELVVKVTDLAGASKDVPITVAVRNVGVEIVNGTANGDLIKSGSGGDQLKGNGGNDTLHGGGGKDTLTGGADNDVFVFDTAPNAKTNIDTIADFKIAEDKIYLENSVFIRLGSGGTPANPLGLGEAAFLSGADITAGTTAAHRIVYNTTTGALFYDSDGAGNGTTNQAAVQFATLSGKPALGIAQLFII